MGGTFLVLLVEDCDVGRRLTRMWSCMGEVVLVDDTGGCGGADVRVIVPAREYVHRPFFSIIIE